MNITQARRIVLLTYSGGVNPERAVYLLHDECYLSMEFCRKYIAEGKKMGENDFLDLIKAHFVPDVKTNLEKARVELQQAQDRVTLLEQQLAEYENRERWEARKIQL